MIINRVWAMPNKNTFTIKPIRELIQKYLHGESVDPFANSNKFAKTTNDIDPQYGTDFHVDALQFLKMFYENSMDTVLFDPPYSSQQVAESYKKMSLSVNMETTQGSYWSKLKEQIGIVVKPRGVCITCGWNSGGIGMKYGFKIIEILLVPHGSWHHDTIITVERKLA